MTGEKKDGKHPEIGNDIKPIVGRCIVHGCEECPMFYNGRDYQSDKLLCNHPEAPCQLSTPLEPIPKVKPIEIDCSGSGEEIDMSYVEWVVTPDWCPLKVEPILIEYSG